MKVKWQAKQYNSQAFAKLELVRFLDDWAYQANVRAQIEKPIDIRNLMQPYETRLNNVLKLAPSKLDYTYPWKRKFEIEVRFV